MRYREGQRTTVRRPSLFTPASQVFTFARGLAASRSPGCVDIRAKGLRGPIMAKAEQAGTAALDCLFG